MDILPAQTPGPTRQTPEISARVLALALAVVVLVAGGAYFAFKGDSSSSTAATAASSTALSTTPAAAAPHATLPKMSGRAFARRVTRAISHQAGVHVEVTANEGGVPLSVTADSGRNSGRQLLRIQGQYLEGRYVRGVLYTFGSEAVLEHLANFPAPVAEAGAGRWVAVHRGDAPFHDGREGMTVGNFYTATLGMVGHLILTGPRLQGGVETIGIQGRDFGAPSVPETVWVRARGAPLPVLDLAVGSTRHGSINESATFSDWGKPVHIRAPGGSVSYQSLVAQTA